MIDSAPSRSRGRWPIGCPKASLSTVKYSSTSTPMKISSVPIPPTGAAAGADSAEEQHGHEVEVAPQIALPAVLGAAGRAAPVADLLLVTRKPACAATTGM